MKNPFSVVFCCPERRTGQLLATVLPPRHNKAIPHNNAPLLVLLAGEVAEAAEDAVEALPLDLCPPLSRAFSAIDLKKTQKGGRVICQPPAQENALFGPKPFSGSGCNTLVASVSFMQTVFKKRSHFSNENTNVHFKKSPYKVQESSASTLSAGCFFSKFG